MQRLGRAAFKENLPYLQPALNIHDDLTFVVPIADLQSAIERIVTEMLSCPFSWVQKVPLSVEVSTGANWFTMQKLGNFSSLSLTVV